jgi:hypothetical protein
VGAVLLSGRVWMGLALASLTGSATTLAMCWAEPPVLSACQPTYLIRLFFERQIEDLVSLGALRVSYNLALEAFENVGGEFIRTRDCCSRIG